jgi:hypothetical protein
MAEERQSFWDRIFSIHTRSDREEKVLEYVIHRLGMVCQPEESVIQELIVTPMTETSYP